MDDMDDIADIGDAQDMTDEMEDDLDEMASAMGGDGGGEITIGDVSYEFEADMCMSQPDLVMDGPVVGSDGSAGWANVSVSVLSREAMSEVFDGNERSLDALFPDGVDTTEEVTLTVEIGRTGRMDSGGDDDPRWVANASSTRDGGVDYERPSTAASVEAARSSPASSERTSHRSSSRCPAARPRRQCWPCHSTARRGTRPVLLWLKSPRLPRSSQPQVVTAGVTDRR